MSRCRKRLGSLTAVALLFCQIQVSNAGEAASTPLERDDTGWTFAFDDDLLTVSGRDRDYTGGLTLTFAGRRTAAWPFSLDPILAKLDPLVPPSHSGIERNVSVLHATQFGALAFTPNNLNAHAALRDERPYASLIYATSARLFADEAGRTAYDTSFTLGALGLRLAGTAQRQLHYAMNAPDIPNGWRHQVSDGGEPTLRATWGREKLLAQAQQGSANYDVLWRLDASVGYLTDVSVALAGRWGRIRSPWWSGGVARGDYAQLAPTLGLPAAPAAEHELYLSAGARVRLRGYNAFLQGQFRASDVSVADSQLERVIWEGWIAANWQLSSKTKVSYLIRLQTPEIRSGAGRRDLVWAGLTLSRSR